MRELFYKALVAGALQEDVDDQPNDEQNCDLYARAHQHGAPAIFRVTTPRAAIFSIPSVHAASV
jgi:hypothetical protein